MKNIFILAIMAISINANADIHVKYPYNIHMKANVPVLPQYKHENANEITKSAKTVTPHPVKNSEVFKTNKNTEQPIVQKTQASDRGCVQSRVVVVKMAKCANLDW